MGLARAPQPKPPKDLPGVTEALTVTGESPTRSRQANMSRSWALPLAGIFVAGMLKGMHDGMFPADWQARAAAPSLPAGRKASQSPVEAMRIAHTSDRLARGGAGGDADDGTVSAIELRPEAPSTHWINFTAAELRSLLDYTQAGDTLRPFAVPTALRVAIATANNTGKGGLAPAARRQLLAGVLLALTSAGGECGPECRGGMRRLLTALHAGHLARVQSLKRPTLGLGPPIYLLHVSKTGGTSLCSLSHYNRCLEHPKANNCHPPGSSFGPVWYASNRKQKEASCEVYRDRVIADNVTYGHLDIVANEAYMDGGEGGEVPALCPEMLYITQLREPTSRVVSHMYQRGVKPPGFSPDQFKQISVAERIERKPDVCSNYMTRVMLGKDVYLAGPGDPPLDETHGAKAVRVLAHFDMVLLLEQKSRAGPLLKQMLGWFNASDMDKRVGRVARADRRPLTDEDTRQILDANRIDAMLYAAALTMFKLDWLAFGDPTGPPLTASSPPLTCENPRRQYPKR